MDAAALAGIAVIGVAAGAVNTIAGGGSLITIPALIFLGLPANVANATNRVGVLLQSLVATRQFRRAGLLDSDVVARTLPFAALGAVAGALVSVDIDEQLFRRVIGAAMLAMLAAIVMRPKRWLAGRAGRAGREEGKQDESRPHWPGWRWLALFAVGFYGGFLQAGVGVFLLAALVVFAGQDLVRGNGAKSVLVALFTIPALAIYVYHDLVAWLPGGALAAGSALGGWIGAKLTVGRGAAFVRWVLVAVIAVSASRLLGLW
jgi:uncharacterized membrane protein YfcA